MGAQDLAKFGKIVDRKNYIINGDFRVWQRGTTFVDIIGGEYGADRWNAAGSIISNGGNTEMSRQAFALGQTDVPFEPEYFLRLSQTVASSGGTNGLNLRQFIEGVRTLAGQKVTLSFYCKASKSLSMSEIYLNQDFGTGGSPSSSNVKTVATNVALTTSWQRFEYTVTLDSIAGKTLGTDDNDSLKLIFRLPDDDVYDVDFAQIQLEVGSVATDFEYRPLVQELQMCYRYFENFDSRDLYSSYNGSGICNYAFFYKELKRAIPTITKLSGTFNLTTTYDDSFIIQRTGGSSHTTTAVNFIATIDAEL